MADIFVSHAVVDQKLVTLLVDFLKEAIGVPVDGIFCSSIPDHGIPLAADFNAYIKQQLQKPKLTLLLLTPSYLESAFCMMELGAAWAQDHTALAIVVDPVPFATVTNTLGLKQAMKIDSATGPIELRKLIVASGVTLEKRGEHAWDNKRDAWRADIKKAVRKVAAAKRVPAADHATALAKVEEQAAEIEELEASLDRQRELIAKLEAAKSADDVKRIKREALGDQGLENHFEELLAEVKARRPANTSNSVFKHLLTDHFGKAGEIDWYGDRDAFTQAIKYNILDNDPPHDVKWKSSKLKPLRAAIAEVVSFLDSEEGREFSKAQDEDDPMDPEDLAFWEWHLNLPS